MSDLQTVFPLPPGDAGFTYPVAQYDHDEGPAVAGGVVLRVPGTALVEHLVFGDIVSGRIFHARIPELVAADDGDPDTTATVHELHLLHGGVERTLPQVVAAALGRASVERVDLRFGADLDGAVYVTTKQDGFVRRLVPLPLCSDRADNDGDGGADWDGAGAGPPDPACQTAASTRERTPCQDGVDSDGRTGIDFDGGASLNGGVPVDVPDPQCTAPWATRESATGCGLGVELAVAIGALLGVRARRGLRASRGSHAS